MSEHTYDKNGRHLNFNLVTPRPEPDAQHIVELIKHEGRTEGYVLSGGKSVSKEEGVALAKSGKIAGVAVAARNGSEYLRSLPDGAESNNLGNLPSVSQ